MPALLTRKSSCPNSAATDATAASTASASVMSTPNPGPPSSDAACARALGVDVEHRHARALVHERARQRAPDATRRAGDDPGAALQLPTHDRTSSRAAASTT